MTKKLAKNFNCASEFTLDLLGGKWKTVILCNLSYQPLRFGELHKLLPKLSEKVLTERLHELRARGLVAVGKPGAHQKYTLTAEGRSLDEVLTAIYDWGITNAPSFGVKVDEPLKRLGYRQERSRKGSKSL